MCCNEFCSIDSLHFNPGGLKSVSVLMCLRLRIACDCFNHACFDVYAFQATVFAKNCIHLKYIVCIIFLRFMYRRQRRRAIEALEARAPQTV